MARARRRAGVRVPGRFAVCVAVGLAWLAAAWPAAAATTVRAGEHGGFSRVVFTVPPRVVDSFTQQGDRLVLYLPGAGAVPGAAQGAKNVGRVEGGQDQAALILAPGSHSRVWRTGARVVVDVYPPPAAPGAVPAAQAVGAGPAPHGVGASRGAGARDKGTRDKGAPDFTLVPVGQSPLPPAGAGAAGARAAVPAATAAAGLGGTQGQGGTQAEIKTPAQAAVAGAPGAPAGALPNTQPAAGAQPGVPAAQGQAGGPPPPPPQGNLAQGQDTPAAPAPQDGAAPAAEGAAADTLVVVRLPDDATSGAASILVPFDRLVGAAAFARGGVAHVVFDASKPVDMAALKDDAVFGSARVQLLAAATHMVLRLPAGARLRLQRRADGWVVAVTPQGAAEPSARLALEQGALTIAMPHAAETVVMDDPASGERLLVGTVLGEGPGVAVAHVSPEFTVLPSWAGVLVAANSDRLALRSGKAGFSLMTGNPPGLAAQLADASQSAAEAAALTRHFDMPPLPVPALLTRLRAALHAAGAAPRLGRLAARLQAAQAMLALGLDREAGGTLRTAQQDDPAQSASPDAAALLAMADWLAGLQPGPGAAASTASTSAEDIPARDNPALDNPALDNPALDNPALGTSDEITLWRALMQPAGSDRRPAAAALASTWRLLLAYPEPLRRRLARPVADGMLQGGQLDAAEALLARMPEPSLDDLRAAALVQRGKVPEALALFDKVSRRADRKQAAAAGRAAVELRLAAHQLTPAQAAAELDKRLYAWRDEAIEVGQRLRVAALRTQAGNWRQALALLRDTDGLFPAAHDQVRSAELAVIADLLRAGQAQRLPPLDLVALVEESADLLAARDASATLAPVLVDKLLALDLPERAEPILARLMAATDAAEPKAGLGARLATLRLEAANPAGALAALDASEAAGLPADLVNQRGVLRARALALLGRSGEALAMLAALSGADALALQAQLQEQLKDWHGAERTLLALANATLPATGALTPPQQDLILREASAAAQAGDMAVLQQLQTEQAKRLDGGSRLALFQALVQQPVQSLTDLPRSGREAVAARAVPAALASFEAR